MLVESYTTLPITHLLLSVPQTGSSVYSPGTTPSPVLCSALFNSSSNFAAHNALPPAVVSRNNMLRTGINCSISATVPNHVYIHRRSVTNAFRCLRFIPLSLKYRQCCSGPARYPVMNKNSGTPIHGTRFSGNKTINSTICLILNGPYTADRIGFPNRVRGFSRSSPLLFSSSTAGGSTGRLTATSASWPLATRTASKMSTWASSANQASNSRATMAALSPRTRTVPLNQAEARPWKRASRATWGR